MIQKKNIPILVQLVLCIGISSCTPSIEAFNVASLARTVSRGFALIKKITKISAVVGCGYWVARSILQHGTPRHETSTYKNPVGRLVVYTDGKVTVRKSSDNTMKVTHKYGASWRSDLSQITFSQKFDEHQDTLTVQGLLEPCPTGRFHRFIQWLFRIKPQRTLHHIIEVPSKTNVEITTQNSDRYTHNRQKAVHIDSISGNIVVHAVSGNVEVANSQEKAKLVVQHKRLPSDPEQLATQTSHSKKISDYSVTWDTEYRGKIEIHTPDQVMARGFRGDLSIFGSRLIHAEKGPQNTHAEKIQQNAPGKTLIFKTLFFKELELPESEQDGFEQPFTPPAQQIRQCFQLWSPETCNIFECKQDDKPEKVWTEEQLNFLKKQFSSEQLQLWTVKQLQLWTNKQLRCWTIPELQKWLLHWQPKKSKYKTDDLLEPEKIEDWTPAQLLQWSIEKFKEWASDQFEQLTPEQLKTLEQIWTKEQLVTLTQNWTAPQLQRWITTQLKNWSPDEFTIWSTQPIERWKCNEHRQLCTADGKQKLSPQEVADSALPKKRKRLADCIEQWKTDELEHWTIDQLKTWLPTQLNHVDETQLRNWIPQKLQDLTKAWQKEQLEYWLPVPLQNWKELLLKIPKQKEVAP